MGLFGTVERASVKADTISFNPAISAREEGQEWQLAVGLLSTIDQARVEADTTGFITGRRVQTDEAFFHAVG